METALKSKNIEIEEFEKIIEDLANHEVVLEMKKYRQHYDCSCYDHCKKVAFYTYSFCKKHNLDYVSGARAAMIHDLFLYDWRIKSDKSPRLHGFRHPRIALNNAMKYFTLNEKEQDIILKHMWPLTLALPKYKESFVVTFADKYSALHESIEHYKKNEKFQKINRYTYVFLCLLVLKII